MTKCLGLLACSGAVVATLLYVKLLHSPISLKMLASSIESSIAADLSGMSLKIDDAELRLGQGGRVEFGLRNVRLLDSNGLQIGQAPTATIEVSGKALRYGQVAPERIQLISPRLNISVGDNHGGPQRLRRPSPRRRRRNRSRRQSRSQQTRKQLSGAPS